MLLTLLQFFATKFLFLALHLEAGSFPPPAQPTGGDPDLRRSAGRRSIRPGKAHPPQSAPSGAHRKEILCSPL